MGCVRGNGVIPDLLFQKLHSVRDSPVLTYTRLRLVLPDLSAYQRKDCFQEIKFTAIE